MKPKYLLFIFLPFVLWLTACEQTRPGIIENLIFSENDQWLERDVLEDPYELVEDQCCNDYNPYPLPIDTTIYPVIAPAGDLDYFNLQITADSVGQLLLRSELDNVTMRIFSRNLEEYDFLLDTLYNYPVDNFEQGYWTILYGLDFSFTMLLQGESRSNEGQYSLSWRSITHEDGLEIIYPKRDYRWRRNNTETISWGTVQSQSVTAALLKGPVIIQFIKSDSNATYYDDEPKLDWHIPNDLELGTDYRIMIYFTDNPERMSISDAFEIYY
ncbi:MAG: hypothetical protein JSU77_00390 [Fidelibacterota bacterium]|nr:MAG: hypothetical protein JSU77_00390 [Candidatus Neomarinimicrobiota bacterium]